MTRKGKFIATVLGCSMMAGGAAFAASTPHSSTAVRPDSQITSEVRSKLANESEDMGMMQVATKAGVVTLSGYANTGSAELRAVSDARAVAGVSKVENKLHIRM